MTPLALRARQWCVAAAISTQIAATAAGMLPWWGLPVTLAVTIALSRPPSGIDRTGTRATRGLAVSGVAIFAVLIAVHTATSETRGADPVATLRSLTEALVVLSLVIAPSARTPREHRVWLTVTTGVLVAAAAGEHTATSAYLSIAAWVIMLIGMARVQASAAYAEGAIGAQELRGADRPRSAFALAGLRQSHALVPVMGALLAAGLVYFALPAGLGGGGIARRIAHHVAGGESSATATRATAGVDTYGDGDLSLLVRGALPTTPILRVPLTSPSLWRGTYYANYTGTNWETGDNQHFAFTRDDDATLPRLASDPVPVGHVATYAATFPTPVFGSLVWAPGVPLHLSASGRTLSGIGQQSANVRLIGRGGEGGGITGYDVQAAVATTSPARLRSASGADPADPEWKALPRELPASVGQLAREVTRGASNRFDQVADIERYLRTHETYTLNSPVPGAGQDAVADFLFRDHTGFCEQFASAEAVMLRTLGAPTRLVTGLAYGQQSGGTRLYTAADAHAWVEVYYPGIGWSPSDPTAGAVLAPNAASHHSAVDRALRRVADALPGGRVALGAFGLVALVALGLIVGSSLRQRGRPRVRRGRRAATGPVLSAFNRLTGHARAPAPRAPQETAREYIGRVAYRGSIADPGPLESALATLEQECYGDTPPDPEAAADAVAAFKNLLTDTRT